MPNIRWMLGDMNVSDEIIADARKSQVVIKLNLSKKDSIEIGKYRYLVPPPP
jgi:hypothetical protein